MLYGIFSNVHANFEALDAALLRMEALGVEFKVFLGNAVGYGPDPNLCLDRIRAAADLAVLGGADLQLLQREFELGSFYFCKTLRWTGSVITQENRDFLQGLPDFAEHDSIHFQHGAPIGKPRDFYNIQDPEDSVEAFNSFPGNRCFYGNWAGKPTISLQDENGKVRLIEGIGEQEFHPDHRMLVDVGSVGQPRDRNPKAGFVTYDSVSGILREERVAYDIDKAVAKMKRLDFPEFLMQRLYEGR
ncbi:MAG: metallophosphoesterase family protein [Fibrobacterota bacterium]|nr:metallophosphoesterase family protein [Fibrobacterota bacterium]QQS07577.1 MAG: metallophosphoesterase family protein [Fibrobacterota bacterium]